MTYKEALKVLGVSYTTLRRYVKKGLIRRYEYQMPHMRGKMNYWDEDVYALVGRKWSEENIIAGYVRVKGRSPKDLEKLEEQKEVMRQFCTRRGIALERVYEDCAPGTDYSAARRPGLHELMQDILNNKVQALVVDRVDRLSRVGQEMWTLWFKYNKCDLVVMNPVLEDPYYQEEQSGDLATLIQRAGLDRSGDLLEKGTAPYPKTKGVEGPAGDQDTN